MPAAKTELCADRNARNICGADGAAYQAIHPPFFCRNRRLAREEEFGSREADPWTVMTSQEKITGDLLYWGLALSLLLVYLALPRGMKSGSCPSRLFPPCPLRCQRRIPDQCSYLGNSCLSRRFCAPSRSSNCSPRLANKGNSAGCSASGSSPALGLGGSSVPASLCSRALSPRPRRVRPCRYLM